MNILIEKIVNKRKELNISQRVLAYKCGIPQSTLARIETERTVPMIDTLNKIVEALDMEIKIEEKPEVIPELSRWNELQFCAYWKDELISSVRVEGTTAYITRFILHPIKQIFYADKMDIFQLSGILEDRCWERGRADIREILKCIGLDNYDPLEIVKKTHGVTYNDFLWFQFSGENYCYEDMKSGRCR